MADRTDLPKIKPDEKPSLLNHEAGKWGVLGALISAIPAAIAMSTGRLKLASGISAAGWIGGAVYGAFSGKAQQEKEGVEGRTVKNPGYWNKGILSGWTAVTLVTAPFYLAGRRLPSIVAGPLAIAAMVAGSIWRKNSLQHDFDKSVALRDGNHAKTQELLQAAVANQHAPAVPAADEISFKNSVTPNEAAALFEKQGQTPAPAVEKPAHGPHHAAHAEHHEAKPHAAKHEHHQHTGSHTDKHEPAASHADHAAKPEAGMAMGAA